MNDHLTLTITQGEPRPISPLLHNLLEDTSAPILAYLSDRYGLPRVPGLAQAGLIRRLLSHLSDDELHELEDDLIAARYGSLSVDDLLDMALTTQQTGRAGAPRLEDMPVEQARLVEGGPQRWAFTMHGYDVLIDVAQRRMACGCEYFKFAAHRHALCKHLARALTLIPPVYARDALIDLLVTRQYGGPDMPPWEFTSLQAA